MNINYFTGDLLDATENVIVHGCNAQGVMGSGVALGIREKWPENYYFYHDYYKNYGLELGLILPYVVYVPDTKFIINAITQENFGRENKCYVDYDAIETCFTSIDFVMARLFPGQGIAMPAIGSGLGGGSWKIIKDIIEKNCKNCKPVVYLKDGKIPSS